MYKQTQYLFYNKNKDVSFESMKHPYTHSTTWQICLAIKYNYLIYGNQLSSIQTLCKHSVLIAHTKRESPYIIAILFKSKIDMWKGAAFSPITTSIQWMYSNNYTMT